jgi:hypothetical protein
MMTSKVFRGQKPCPIDYPDISRGIGKKMRSLVKIVDVRTEFRIEGFLNNIGTIVCLHA